MQSHVIETVTIALQQQQYDIKIGTGMINYAADYICETTNANNFFIITDKNVAPLYLDNISNSLKKEGFKTYHYIIDIGEKSKSSDVFINICHDFLSKNITRDSCIIALGGGVVGDIAGFVAASIMRGIDFIQIPTSLLAQVDSSVGGKTGINSPYGKNLIGAFYQPRLVLTDLNTISTLPQREITAGYAEIIKHGLIRDSDFFVWCENGHGKKLLQKDENALSYAVAHSCKTKANIVSQDEKEQGQRALLNLGHTFAHAYESLLGYDGRMLHGEAVLRGLLDALTLSYHASFCDRELQPQLQQHYQECGIDHDMTLLKSYSTDEILYAMGFDKKIVTGKKKFIVCRDIGQACIADNIHDDIVTSVLNKALKR